MCKNILVNIFRAAVAKRVLYLPKKSTKLPISYLRCVLRKNSLVFLLLIANPIAMHAKCVVL